MGSDRVKVLIADDSGFMLNSLVKLITNAGYEVVATADNGKNAVIKAISAKPQLVLLDVNMPVENGIYALGMIKKILPDTVVIMMTSDSDPSIIDQCMDLGAGGYILKTDPKEDILNGIMECWESNS